MIKMQEIAKILHCKHVQNNMSNGIKGKIETTKAGVQKNPHCSLKIYKHKIH